MDDSAPDSSASARLEAPLTKWFWRRSLILLGVVLVMGLWFLKDGVWGYAGENAKYQAAIDKREEIWASPMTEIEKRTAWSRYTEEVGGIDDQESVEELREHFKDEGEIREQLYYAAGCGAIGLGFGLWLLARRRKKLVLDERGLQLPDGRLVPFERMRRVDRRKWHKGKAGLAYLFYEDETGETRRATIDGLKYGGFQGEEGQSPPELILKRILVHDHVELLDLASQVGEDPQREESGATDATTGADADARREDG